MKKEVKKPWGNFSQYTLNEKTTVKIITVNKNQSLSLQKHKNRKEFWVILDPGLIVQVGNKKFKAKQGQGITIPKNTIHRVISTKKARFLEISYGNFNEKDIIRLEDRYGRI